MTDDLLHVRLSLVERLRLARAAVCVQVIDQLESRLSAYDYLRDGPRLADADLVVSRLAYVPLLDALRSSARHSLRSLGSDGLPLATLLSRIIDELATKGRAAGWAPVAASAER